jgi:O-antigen ligase
MKRSTATRLCFGLLVACVPASMLCVMWFPGSVHNWLERDHLGLYTFLFHHVYPFLPSWPQYLAMQTLAVPTVALCLLIVLSRGGRAWLLSGRRWVFPALVASYAVWSGLTYFWSAWPYGTRAYWVRELPFYMLAIAAAMMCGRERRWRTFAAAFVASAFVEAVLQLAVIIYVARVDKVSVGKVFLSEAVFYSNPNFGCAIVLTASFIAVALATGALLRRRPPEGEPPPSPSGGWLAGAGALAALGVFGTVFFIANSLAAQVALVLAAGAFALFVAPLKRVWPVLVAAAVLGAGVVVTFLASSSLQTKAMRVLMSPYRTTSLRIVHWLACKEMYERRPLQGWGMGTFPAIHMLFHPTIARKLPLSANLRGTHPHNEFARVAAEQGVVGLVLYSAILIYAFAVSYKALRNRPLEVRLIGYALWAGALTFVVHCAFGKEPMNWSFSGNYWMLLGVLASAGDWLWKASPPESVEESVHLAPPAWAVWAVAVAGLAWGWWAWAWGGYASQVHMNQAHVAQLAMGRPPARQQKFDEFQEQLELSRPRCLWPDEILHMDYAAGWFLTRQGQWVRAADKLEKLQQVAPEFLKARLFLAECYLGMGRIQRGWEALHAYLARNPYDLEAYDTLWKLDPAIATSALESHVLGRLKMEEDWIIEDYPTDEEVRRLLGFYASRARWMQVRALTQQLTEFFRTHKVGLPYDPLAQVRWLADQYERMGREELGKQLRQAIPEAWPTGG